MHKNHLFYLIDDQVAVTIHICDLTAVVQKALDVHGCNRSSGQIFAESLIGSMLIASFLKMDESINVKFVCEDAIGQFVAEANCLGQIRAYPSMPNCALDYNALGQTMTSVEIQSIRVSNKENKRYSSVVRSHRPGIADAVEHYFDQSQQTQSLCRICTRWQDDTLVYAGGFILQNLPGKDDSAYHTYRQKIEAITNLPALMEAARDNTGMMLDKLLTAKGKPILKEKTAFSCHCTRENFARGLFSLDAETLSELFVANETIETTCQYCKKIYPFAPSEIEAFLKTRAKHPLN